MSHIWNIKTSQPVRIFIKSVQYDNVVSNCAVMALVLFHHKQKKPARSCAVLIDNNVTVFENFKNELYTTFNYVQ